MQIDEAIEEQKNYLNDPFHDSSERFRESIMLGIEALKQIKDMRDFKYWGRPTKLPGETEK